MTVTQPVAPEDLRARMVEQIVAQGYLRTDRIRAAMATIPRHRFLPAATAEEAYENRSVTTKAGDNGRSLSCASQPTIVAMMLEQLDPRPGQRILEIGAGTGYNAALLAELVGASGSVTTIDIDPEVTAGARAALDASGYDHVRVALRDGSLGDVAYAPYDGILVAVGPWDIPLAWIGQLAPGGRLVVPLRWRGQARSVAFVREGDHLRSESVRLCGFIPMLGPGQDGERVGAIDLDGHVTLHWDADQAIDPHALDGVLAQGKAVVWSGATVRAQEPFDGIWLRLTAAEPGTCRIAAAGPAVEAGLCNPAIPVRSPALVEDNSLAYLTLRKLEGEGTKRRWELGANGHGPAGPQLAERLCRQIRAWGHHRAALPRIAAYAAGTPDTELPSGFVIDKVQTRLVIAWPPEPSPQRG